MIGIGICMPKIRVELLLAWPPTSLCKRLDEIANKVAAEFGESVEVNVCYRGQTYSSLPTAGFMQARKWMQIPAILVDGELVAQKELPTEESLRAMINKKLDASI